MKIPARGPVVCPTVVGRAIELSVLRSLLDRAKNEKGHVTLVSGEAGIGKSRLIDEAKSCAVDAMPSCV